MLRLGRERALIGGSLLVKDKPEEENGKGGAEWLHKSDEKKE
jgi:hypothetical protein